MRNGEEMVRGQSVTDLRHLTMAALRRRFLLDLTYPEVGTELCELFGLPPASEDVMIEEIAAAKGRMARLGKNTKASPLICAAQDMHKVLDNTEDNTNLWLIVYALAVVNILEELGLIVVVDV